ncbi:MAG: zinc ABC transporter substrate-binding protein [Clostridia bacterium]|nr:zinc ABC transporter substrate-binding protein [Clostridia bacterium]
MTVLEDLWYGNIDPHETVLNDDRRFKNLLALMGRNRDKFETILFLANKADELGLRAILQIESADGKIARTVKDTTKTKDQTILTLDSMQSTTMADVENGVTYLSIMEKNLEVLKDALK